MDISTFMKAYTLLKTANSSDIDVIVSDINHDNQITESTFEAQCEWRQPYRSSLLEPIDKPSDITWSAIAEYKTEAETVADFSN